MTEDGGDVQRRTVVLVREVRLRAADEQHLRHAIVGSPDGVVESSVENNTRHIAVVVRDKI